MQRLCLLFMAVSVSAVDHTSVFRQPMSYTDCQNLIIRMSMHVPIISNCLEYASWLMIIHRKLDTRLLIHQDRLFIKLILILHVLMVLIFTKCVPVNSNEVYNLKVVDAGGDGICCSKGLGYFNVYLGVEQVFSSDGKYDGGLQTSIAKPSSCVYKSLEISTVVTQKVRCTPGFYTDCSANGQQLVEICLEPLRTGVATPFIAILNSSSEEYLVNSTNSTSAALCVDAASMLSIVLSNLNPLNNVTTPWNAYFFVGESESVWTPGSNENVTTYNMTVSMPTDSFVFGHFFSTFYSYNNSVSTYMLCSSSSHALTGNVSSPTSSSFISYPFYHQLPLTQLFGNFTLVYGSNIYSWNNWSSGMGFRFTDSNTTACNLFEVLVDLNSPFAADSYVKLDYSSSFGRKVILSGSPFQNQTSAYACDIGNFNFLFQSSTQTPQFQLLVNGNSVLKYSGNTVSSVYAYQLQVAENSVTVSQNKTSCGTVDIGIYPDSFYGELSWKLSNVDTGEVIGSAKSVASTYSTTSVFLCFGNYVFEIDDSFGDGLCCNYGSGSYNLTFNGYRFFRSSGEFGTGVLFCCERQCNCVQVYPQSDEVAEVVDSALYLIFPGVGTLFIILISTRLIKKKIGKVMLENQGFDPCASSLLTTRSTN
jgi:hypothetical protein